jgi:hypothetical protein
LAVLPIASSSGPAIIAGVVAAAALFLAWLLRTEAREEATEAQDETDPHGHV